MGLDVYEGPTSVLSAAPAASTPKALSATNLKVNSVSITNLKSNSNDQYVGGSDVDEATETGHLLEPGKSVTFDNVDLANVYFVNAGTEKVSYTYVKDN